MIKTSNWTLPLLLSASLAGCGSLSDTLGFGKSSPDEFNVVKRAPLILPPEYNLRPLNSKDRRPAQPTGAELAQIVTLGAQSLETKTDPAEAALLEKASQGEEFGDGIRERLENERRGTSSEAKAVTDALVEDNAPAGQ